MEKILKHIFFITLLLYSGIGIKFFERPESVFILLFLSILYVLIFNIKFHKTFFIIELVWFIYAILSTIALRNFHIYLFIYFPIQILSSYVLIKLLEVQIFELFEKYIYYFSIISLFFFSWHTINESSFYNFMEIFNINKYSDYYVGQKIRYNIIIYNVNHLPNWSITRNSGFCWEPGPFGCFIVIAVFFNLLRTKFQFIKNKIFWVLIITLITTQSTTAFISFFLLIIWIVLNNKLLKKISVIAIPSTIILSLVLFLTIPFLRDKIVQEYEKTETIDEMVMLSLKTDSENAPGRFESLIITWIDFIERPLLGYGVESELQWTSKLGAMIFPASGIGNWLARYGIYGFVIWMIVLISSSKFIYNSFGGYNFKNIWLFLTLSISIGFSIVFSPIYMSFYFIYMFYNRKNSEFQETDLLNSY